MSTEGAIEWLCLAGLVHRVSALETPRLPLSAYKKSNAFKLYLNDVGLLGRKFDLDVQTVLAGDNLFTEFKGVMAENYVLQALFVSMAAHITIGHLATRQKWSSCYRMQAKSFLSR